MNNIIIMGSGGLGIEAVWGLEDINAINKNPVWNILGYVDDDITKIDKYFYNYKVLGTPENVAKQYMGVKIWYYCAIGNNHMREKVVERLDELGWHAATIIHTSVIIAKNISIAEGSYVCARAVIGPNAKIGKHVLINTCASVGHDTTVSDFSQVSPGAQISGFCKVGKRSVIGSNATLYQGVSVGEDATVGSNSFVIRSVKSGNTVIGVPAQTVKYTDKLVCG